MDRHVTLLRPGARAEDSSGFSSALPPDLLEQVRGRLRALALIMLVAFSIDPLLFFGGGLVLTLRGTALPPDYGPSAFFYLGDIAVAAASAGLWMLARSRRIATSRLHTIALVYEVAICFFIALRTIWEYYRQFGMLPNLTWAPAVVILFPLIVPMPPRRMMVATIAAAAMPVVALVLLAESGRIAAGAAHYFNAAVSSLIAVGFAFMGSRVVYRLGREVAAAREMGSYRLEEKLGQGGMGEVWRARHRMLARPAAIKLIKPSLIRGAETAGSSDAERRFEREAQAIARLRSPHTVELFDFGVSSDGTFYYVMELLDGLDADRLVRDFGPVPAERAVHLLRQICHSLSEAESCGLVHRDIKPANIFLCRYGEEYDFVKVLDFGIVKAPDETAGDDPAVSRAGAVQGTPAFIAPEQALGETLVDSRADIYATGCVAYWLLTGQLVFEAETSIGLMLHHAQTAPVAPSTRTALAIPAALDALVLECLAKDPAERPQSARELSRRLAEVASAGPWTEVRARDWWADHHPLPVAGLAPSAATVQVTG